MFTFKGKSADELREDLEQVKQECRQAIRDGDEQKLIKLRARADILPVQILQAELRELEAEARAAEAEMPSLERSAEAARAARTAALEAAEDAKKAAAAAEDAATKAGYQATEAGAQVGYCRKRIEDAQRAVSAKRAELEAAV